MARAKGQKLLVKLPVAKLAEVLKDNLNVGVEVSIKNLRAIEQVLDVDFGIGAEADSAEDGEETESAAPDETGGKPNFKE